MGEPGTSIDLGRAVCRQGHYLTLGSATVSVLSSPSLLHAANQIPEDHTMNKLLRTRHLGLMAGLAFLASPFLLNSQWGGASEGPGTEWKSCRADAHQDMAHCYWEESESRWGYMMCNVAWELDLIGCDLDLIEAYCRFDWCEKAS